MDPVAPLVDTPHLERAINRARWAGVVLVLGLSPLYPNLGLGWVVAFVALIAIAAGRGAADPPAEHRPCGGHSDRGHGHVRLLE